MICHDWKKTLRMVLSAMTGALLAGWTSGCGDGQPKGNKNESARHIGVSCIVLPVLAGADAPAARMMADWHSAVVWLALAVLIFGVWQFRLAGICRRQLRKTEQLNDELRSALAVLEFGAELTGAASFRLNIRTREITGSMLLTKLWPIRDGKALPCDVYVYAPDLPGYVGAMDALLHGKSAQGSWNYRSEYWGGMRYFRVTASVAQGPTGDPCLVGVVQDVSEIALNAEKIKKAQELCDIVINSIPMFLFVKDVSCGSKYVLANEALAHLLRIAPDQIVGKTDAELPGLATDAEAIRRKDMAIVDSGKNCEFDETVFGADGVLRYCHTVKKTFVDADGRSMLLGVSTDVTSSHKLMRSEQVTGAALKQIVLDADFDRNLDYIAKLLQKFTSCDRVMVAQCTEDGWLYLYREWHGAAVADLTDEERQDHLTLWNLKIERFKAGEVLGYGDIQALPELRAILHHAPRYPAKSLIAAPIFIDDQFYGVVLLAFVEYNRHFSAVDENLLRATASMVAIARIRERQTRAMERADREKQLILNNISIPMTLHGADGKLLHANTATCKLTGKTEAELLEEEEKEVFFLHEKVPADSPLKQVIAGKPTASLAVKIHTRDFIVHADAVTDENGKLVNIVKSALDVTDLNRALLRAREADKAKSYFIASVSHEIRTPLNAIIGFSELLLGGDVPEAERDEYLRSIAFSGSALLQIINDVLDLSKLEAEQMKIVLEPADFKYIAQETMKVFAHRLAEKHLESRFDVAPVPMLLLDKLRIRQILFNLIGNAIKFTQQGKITLYADFQAADAMSGTLVLEVRDTGIGISPDGLKKLAQPFVQVSGIRSNNAVTTGTGLGLAITKRLIDKMGGRLETESAVGRGSVFRVILPGMRLAGTTQAGPESPVDETAFPQIQQSQLSILLVDDVAMNLKVMTAMCRKLGIHNVTTAGSGAQALEMLEKHTFDLILTDMWMPGMAGDTLAEKIHAIPRFAQTPIIAVTADSEAERNFALTAFAGVLLKPVTIEKMQKTIKLALNSGGGGGGGADKRWEGSSL